MNINKKKQFAAFLSIISNSFLIIIKFSVGLLTGSVSIISEAIHSFSDLLASVIAFFSVSIASEPADKKHQFGHGKFEDFSGFFEGLLILAASLYIVHESFLKFNTAPDQQIETVPGIIVMALSVVLNIFVSKYLFKIGKQADSIALIADAQHLKTDILTSAGVLIGLVLIKFTGLSILDPIIALIVAVMIFRTSISLCYETAVNLLDGSLPEEDIILVQKIVQSYIPAQVQNIVKLKTRKAGSQKIINMTLAIHENFTIKQGHDLCDKIESDIKHSIKNTTITIHLEPCSDDCKICK